MSQTRPSSTSACEARLKVSSNTQVMPRSCVSRLSRVTHADPTEVRVLLTGVAARRTGYKLKLCCIPGKLNHGERHRREVKVGKPGLMRARERLHECRLRVGERSAVGQRYERSDGGREDAEPVRGRRLRRGG